MEDENQNPETQSPVKKLAPVQVITILLYPVVFAIGLSVGLVIGLKQGEKSALANQNNRLVNQIPSTVVPGTNTAVINAPSETNENQNANIGTNVNATTNTSAPILNTNGTANADYLLLDAGSRAQLSQQEEAEKQRVVDETLPVTDVLRQQELVSLKYDLLAYHAVRKAYPNSGGEQIRLDRGVNDVFYAAMKDFFGGTYNQQIDPEHPAYYYGYTSNGTAFQLSAYLVSKRQPFFLQNE